MVPLPLMARLPSGTKLLSSMHISSSLWAASLRWMVMGYPVLSMREAVLTVSPRKQ